MADTTPAAPVEDEEDEEEAPAQEPAAPAWGSIWNTPAAEPAAEEAPVETPAEEPVAQETPAEGPAPFQWPPVAAAPAQPEEDRREEPPVETPVSLPHAPLFSPSAGRGETTLLGSGQGETVLLAQPPEEPPKAVMPRLRRVKTGDEIPLDRPVFCMGTELGKVDYCVLDNPWVSRVHAEILTDRDQSWLVDRGATNRTYINGRALLPNQPTLLENGQHIHLANEEFIFLKEG